MVIQHFEMVLDSTPVKYDYGIIIKQNSGRDGFNTDYELLAIRLRVILPLTHNVGRGGFET